MTDSIKEWFGRIPPSVWIFVVTQIFLVLVWGVRIDRRVDDLEEGVASIEKNTGQLPGLIEREKAFELREANLDRRIDIILQYLSGAAPPPLPPPPQK